MKKNKKEIVLQAFKDLNSIEREHKSVIKDYLREVADLDEGFGNQIFEIGVDAVTKAIMESHFEYEIDAR